MGSLIAGAGSGAVASSAHAGCPRFRATDPLITGRTRRALAKTLRDNFAVNTIVLYGSAPVVSAISATPPFYAPAVGLQQVSFDLTSTFAGQPVSVSLTFLNQTSGSVLRTVTQSGLLPGHVSIPWDGRADNGDWVAPGVYVVTATLSDSIGNQVSRQILTNVSY